MKTGLCELMSRQKNAQKLPEYKNLCLEHRFFDEISKSTDLFYVFSKSYRFCRNQGSAAGGLEAPTHRATSRLLYNGEPWLYV